MSQDTVADKQAADIYRKKPGYLSLDSGAPGLFTQLPRDNAYLVTNTSNLSNSYSMTDALNFSR